MARRKTSQTKCYNINQLSPEELYALAQAGVLRVHLEKVKEETGISISTLSDVFYRPGHVPQNGTARVLSLTLGLEDKR
jgi:hypothetical protein